MPKSFDLVGSGEKLVAIVDVTRESGSEKKFVESIMKNNKSVKSVLAKISGREGDYRKLKLKLIGGDNDTEVLHKEHGYFLKVDPQKTYFSPREATERQRLGELVEEGEVVMVMFGGVCVYSIAIAKKQPNVEKIYSVELNPEAHAYALENVRINKLSHKVVPIKGDVKVACKDFYGKCDRVIMPLPLGAGEFLDIAVNCLKKAGGVIHFYGVGNESDLFSEALETIDKSLKNLKKSYTVIGKYSVLPYAPRSHKIRIDFKVE